MKKIKLPFVIPGLTRNPSGYRKKVSRNLVIPRLSGSLVPGGVNLYKFSIIFVFLLLIVVIGYVISQKPKKTFSISPTFSTDFAYDSRTFLPAIAGNKNNTGLSNIGLLILPHHLLASPLIAQGVSSLSRQSPKSLIILSPNHINLGQCDIVTSKNSWNTPFGQVDIDLPLQKVFLDSGTVCLDDEALKVEHGIAGLLPFIKYYLPNTKVVPLALKKDINPELFKLFTQKLTSLAPSSVVLASIDFSHGLQQKEALRRDSLTQKLIANRNYSEISNLSSEYLDSPLSLISALKIIESSNSKLQFTEHTDSSNFNRDTKAVTSYFLISNGLDPESSPTPFSQLSLQGTPWQSTPAKYSNTFTLLFAGDVMLGRSVNTRMLKYSDFTWPFLKVSEFLSQADITLFNLESPFRTGCKPTDFGMLFCADPRSISGLVSSGVDVVNLANNHIDNQGQEGIKETLSILQASDIASIGQGESVIKSIDKTKIAFLGFDDVLPVSGAVTSATPSNVQSQISLAKKNADLVVATFHWGNEYSHHNSRQTYLAHLAIDSGADLIIGHHPHWVQEFEMYKDKPIYYSLGNLVFDQMWSEETRKGLVVKFTYSGTRLINREEFPIKIFDYGQPSFTN